jgi:hypothetical protein
MRAVRAIVYALMAMAIVSACQPGTLTRHRGMADHMLNERGVPDFENASTAEYAAIRHAPSGMLCVMPASGVFEYDVFPADSANAGAQCSLAQGEVVTGWVAVHFSQPTNLDAAFASGVAELTNGLDAQNWLGRPSEADRASPEGLPHYRIHRVRGNFNGEERYLRISMAEMDGWYLQQITSAPLADAPEVEELTGVAWRTALRAFAASRAEANAAQ